MELVDYEDAISLMSELSEKTNDVCVFTDRGWGDDPSIETEYTIIVDGDGQHPKARIEKKTFDELIKNKKLGPNCLQTYKARTLHEFMP